MVPVFRDATLAVTARWNQASQPEPCEGRKDQLGHHCHRVPLRDTTVFRVGSSIHSPSARWHNLALSTVPPDVVAHRSGLVGELRISCSEFSLYSGVQRMELIDQRVKYERSSR